MASVKCGYICAAETPRWRCISRVQGARTSGCMYSVVQWSLVWRKAVVCSALGWNNRLSGTPNAKYKSKTFWDLWRTGDAEPCYNKIHIVYDHYMSLPVVQASRFTLFLNFNPFCLCPYINAEIEVKWEVITRLSLGVVHRFFYYAHWECSSVEECNAKLL